LGHVARQARLLSRRALRNAMLLERPKCLGRDQPLEIPGSKLEFRARCRARPREARGRRNQNQQRAVTRPAQGSAECASYFQQLA
jgi:hypothetical protein